MAKPTANSQQSRSRQWQSLDGVCYLIKTEINSDDMGNQIETPISEQMCFCTELSVYGSEFFNAGQIGIKPVAVLSIDKEGYSGQTSVRYNDKTLTVYRTFVSSERIELHLTAHVGGDASG